MRCKVEWGIIHDSPNDHYLMFSHHGRSLTPSCARSGKRVTKGEQSFAKMTLRTQSQVEVNRSTATVYTNFSTTQKTKVYRFLAKLSKRSYFGRTLGKHLWRSLASFRTATSLFQVRPVPKARHHHRHRRPWIPGALSELSFSLREIISLPSPLHSALPGGGDCEPL